MLGNLGDLSEYSARAITWFVLYLCVGLVLHEFGHIIILSVYDIPYSFNLNMDISSLRFDISHGPVDDPLIRKLSGYSGGLFSAIVMFLFYLKKRVWFITKDHMKSLTRSVPYFAVIGINLMQGFAEGAFRDLYLNNMIFTTMVVLLGVLIGVVYFHLEKNRISQ